MALHNKINWSKEQDEFLKENSSKMTRYELGLLFNKTFNTNYLIDTIAVHCRRNKWKCKDNGRFKKGSKPLGRTPFKHKVGDIVIKKNNTRNEKKYMIVISNEKDTPFYKRIMPYSRYVYENYHKEKTKDDECIIFLDGNYENFDINNLYKIPKKIATQITNNDAWKKGILTQAMIETLITELELNYKENKNDK